MLNRIVIMGRLTRDPELKQTPSGVNVASFTLAVDRDFKNRETGEKATDFIDCVAWRQTAEFASRYLSKGRMAAVEGRLQIREWNDREGNKRRSAEIVVDNIYFGDSKPSGASMSQQGGFGGAASSPAPYQPAGPSAFAELGPDDGELPF